MQTRRDALHAGLALGVAGLAGCADLMRHDDSPPPGETPAPTQGDDDGEAAPDTGEADQQMPAEDIEDWPVFVIAEREGGLTFTAVHRTQILAVGEVEAAEGEVVMVQLSEDGMDSFESALRGAGAMENPEEFIGRTYLDDRIVSQAELTLAFLESVEDGSYDGQIQLVIQEGTAEEFVDELLHG